MLVTNFYAHWVSPGEGFGVLLNNGNGTFGPEQDYLVGGPALQFDVKDLNGDGKPFEPR